MPTTTTVGSTVADDRSEKENKIGQKKSSSGVNDDDDVEKEVQNMVREALFQVRRERQSSFFLLFLLDTDSYTHIFLPITSSFPF